MYAIKVQITRFLCGDNPGFVECKFTDAWNREWVVHEKVPVVTLDSLDATSIYPQAGNIGCTVLQKWTDVDGRAIVTVSSELPWHIETVDEQTQFDLLLDQLDELDRNFNKV